MTLPRKVLKAHKIRIWFNYQISELDKDSNTTTIKASVFIFKVKHPYFSNKQNYKASNVDYKIITDETEQKRSVEYAIYENDNCVYNYNWDNNYMDIPLTTMIDDIEEGEYIRVEIHDMRNPYFFFHNEVRVTFICD